jgi:antibiotic biosynthesis monooxygenase (ABM) superfamily enzyme
MAFMENQGASVVINHHILKGKQNQYEDWLDEIGPICRNSIGNIDWQIIRPIPNLTFNYTVIIRFDTIENLKSWMESTERKKLIEKAKPLFAKDDKYFVKSGLDFLFSPENGNQNVPVRWKQYLVTWSAIYPLSILVPLFVFPTLKVLNFPENKFISSFFVSGIVVFIMVYFLMPKYTLLIKKWLYHKT